LRSASPSGSADAERHPLGVEAPPLLGREAAGAKIPAKIRASLWLLAPVAAGTLLRLWNLPAQVLGGDEMHAVRSALGMRLPEILVTYRQADNCIPLTALYRLVLDAGGVLSEMLLRLPMLVAGIALLALAPLWIDRRLGRPTAAVFAWLLAISPVAVLYSRIARSYMPMLLLGGGAVAAFEAWWRTRRKRWAVAYVVLAALALWFHLGSGPFVVAPLLFAACDLVWGKRQDRAARLAGLAAVGLGLAAACALFLVPAWDSLAGLIATKRQAQEIPARTVLDMMLLQAGTGRSGVAALFWGLALGGLALLAVRRRRFGLYALTVAAGQVAGILILSPIGLAHPWVLNRYLVPVLPWLLVGIAYALAEGGWPAWEEAAGSAATPEERKMREAAGRAARRVSRLAAAAFVALLVVAGPFADAGFRSSSFMHHDDMAGFYLPRASLPAGAVPGFYRALGAEVAAGSREDRGAVIEYPYLFLWRFRSFYVYQEIHGRRVLVATPQRLARRPELALRNALPAQPEAFCRSGARYLVVHEHVAREEDRVTRPEDKAAPAFSRDMRRSLRLGATRMALRLRRLWGKPEYEDAGILVWDLDRVCGLRRRR
jgi:uncharacterized membrane protein